MSRDRYCWMYGLVVVFIWSVTFLGCSAQRASKTELVEGTTCKQLENPPHGTYKCMENEGVKKCVLQCKPGFIHPITEYKNDEKLTLTPYPDQCTSDSERETELISMNPNNVDASAVPLCRERLYVRCQWTYDMKCVGGVWKMDTWFRIPFSLKALNEYEKWEVDMKRALNRDCLQYFVLLRQRAQTIINKESFSLECPQGTRLERDFTCRGCSKGYFLSPLLMECLPCAALRYQDENFGSKCKLCPPGSSGEQTGLTSLMQCYQFSRFEEDTSVFTLMIPLGFIVLLSAVILAFRRTIVNEPDGSHRETYKLPEYNLVGGGPLQRLMRTLYPSSQFPSQFDSMDISISSYTWQAATGTLGFKQDTTKKGKTVYVAEKDNAEISDDSSSDSDDN